MCIRDRIAVASTFEPHKVFDADAGETGNLLTTQTGRTPRADRPQTERRRVDALAAGAQELSECGHSEKSRLAAINSQVA